MTTKSMTPSNEIDRKARIARLVAIDMKIQELSDQLNEEINRM